MSTPEDSYNRPSFPHICGRAKLWEKPCPLGPNMDGSCGGTRDCLPARNGDRWECRRPIAQGGPCADGPLSDGACAHNQPPCQPSASLRVQRFRLTLCAVLLTIAALFAFGSGGSILGEETLTLRDPGPLRAGHLQAFADKGCGVCHAPHDQDTLSFLQASFTPSAPDRQEANFCINCHVVEGNPGDPHKAKMCVSCHAEHIGNNAAVSSITDAQCHTCHKAKFDSFDNGHPPFHERYPHDRRTAVNFDHTKHINTHFVDPRYADKAPAENCGSCHDTARAGRDIPVKPFKETCAACHAEQIKERDLVVFEMPELDHNPIDMKEFADACRLSDENSGEEFESISIDPPNAITTLLMDINPDDTAEYTAAIGELLTSAIEEGSQGIADKIVELDGKPGQLLAGLSPEVLRQAACSWVFNKEYEGPETPENGGWFADELSLRYRAVKHGDAVMEAWLNFAAEQEDEPVNDALLTPEGPGGCIKCHGVSETDVVRVDWAPQSRPSTPHFEYAHKPHLNVLGPGTQCGTCHILNAKVDTTKNYQTFDPMAFNPGFMPMTVETCAQCHTRQQAAVGCLGCHTFHDETGFVASQAPHAIMGKKE